MLPIFAGSRRRIALLMLVGFGIAAMLMLIVFIGFRLHATYAIQTELAKLKTDYRDLQLTCGTNQTEQKDRLDRVWRDLYGDVVPKIEKANGKISQTRIEREFLNTQKELRRRIEKLEAEVWRLRRIVD